jgi:hypothetical protein
MKKIFLVIAILLIGVAVYPILRYTDHGNGAITDNATGLVWQKCYYNQTYSAGSCIGTTGPITWQAALGYCNTLSLAGRIWRLPNINELKSIVDVSRSNPAVHEGFLPTNPGPYWSSTTFITMVSNAYAVDFNNGGVVTTMKTSSAYARCVSTGP